MNIALKKIGVFFFLSGSQMLAVIPELSVCGQNLSKTRAQVASVLPQAFLVDPILSHLLDEAAELEDGVGLLEDVLEEDEEIPWRQHVISNADSYCTKIQTLLEQHFFAFRNVMLALLATGLLLALNFSIRFSMRRRFPSELEPSTKAP